MRRAFRLRPLALWGLSLYCSAALAAPLQSGQREGDFLSAVQGVQVPTLPPVRQGGAVSASLRDAAKLKTLTTDKEHLQQQVAQLQSRLQVHKRQNDSPGPAEATDTALRTLRQEKAELTRKLAQANASLQVSEQRATQGTSSRQSSAERTHMATLQKENVALTTQLRALREQLSAVQSQAQMQPPHRDSQDKSESMEVLTRATNQLKTQLVQVTADRKAQQEARSVLVTELARLQAQSQTQTVNQDGERRVLQRAITALQARLDMVLKQSVTDRAQQITSEGAVRVLTEKLTATQASLTKQIARNGELISQVTALQNDVKKNVEQGTQAEVMLARLTASTKNNADLKTQLATVQAGKTQADKAQADRMAALQAQLAETVKTAADLKTQLVAMQADKVQGAKVQSGAVAALQTHLDGVMKDNVGLRGQVTALTLAQDAAKKSADEARTALSAAQNVAQSNQAQADKAQADRMAALQAQLAETAETNADLNKQLAAHPGSDRPAAPSLDLKTPQAQQAYASGVMMSELLRRTLALQSDLGEQPDTPMLLAGVKDGVTGTLQLDKTVLNAQSEAVIARLSAKEKARYDTGVKRIEILTAKKILLKRNGTMFFVQVRKGSRPLKDGESLNIILRESTLDGRILREGKSTRGIYSERLPYPVQQALMLGGAGGSVDIYCFASDIYPPSSVPEGTFAYTLMKYTVSSRP
ncbi:Uncharacterised protein [Serratia quinivorans]|nr:Uncharacterised protein [Serratia quinivorans]